MPEGRRFLAWLLGAAALLLAAILGITWLVDPYGLLTARGHGAGLCAPGIRVDEQFYVFGASGALVATALTAVLPIVINRTEAS